MWLSDISLGMCFLGKLSVAAGNDKQLAEGDSNSSSSRQNFKSDHSH